MSNAPRFAVIGFGEVGQILAADLIDAGAEPGGLYDPQFADPDSVPSRAVRPPLRAAANAIDAVKGAQLVISAVTAENGLAAAQSVVGGLPPGAFFLDINSVSPGVKGQSFEAVQAAGGRYVEAAVMAAVPGRRINTPMLLGGPNAEAFLELAGPLGFSARVYSAEIGLASAVKMCRSVMIKGLEALITECLLTARRLGVEKDVLASLGETLPVPDWEAFARYMLTRTLQHGKRRAEEMREVARTVSEARIEPLMSRSIAERQDIAWTLGEGVDLRGGLNEILDAILAKTPE